MPSILYDTTPEARLWRHVLARAAIDSAYGSTKIKLEMLGWIQDVDGTGDFDTVCHYAAARADTLAQELFDILSAPRIVAMQRAEKLREAILSRDGSDIPADLQDVVGLHCAESVIP